jgi:cytochrome c oxidase cbb3-type subunit III
MNIYPKTRAVAALIMASVLAAGVISCKREQRRFPGTVEAAKASDSKADETDSTGAHIKNEYEQNAYELSEGKRLFSAYNCNGCHAQGGGGMGPPLMDATWIYGGRPEDVYSTIVQGRPNGMPSFGKKVPEFQVKQLAAYVRSMSGQARKDAAPSRDDHMQGKPPESSMPKQPVYDHKP